MKQLLDLPDCMLEQIFEHLNYDEIAKKRLVSVHINKVCQRLLNIGFTKMMKRHTFNLKKIKSQLPRRESERRNHALAKHADILTCIETRISMLSMTYTKYIDLNLCCFIPGKIIDEVLFILKLVDSTSKPLRAHEVLQELRDISSMAIDHFDEKIAPILKKSFCDLSTQKFGSTIYQIMQSPIETALVMQSDFNTEIMDARPSNRDEFARCQDAQNNRLAIVRMDRKYENIMKKLNRVILLQNRQMRQIRNNSMQISELKTQMVEFRRRLEESASKTNIGQMATIDGAGPSTSSTANMSVGSSPSSSSVSSTCSSASSSSDKSHKSNMKPRTATIILKRRIAEPACTSAAKIAKSDTTLDEN